MQLQFGRKHHCHLSMRRHLKPSIKPLIQVRKKKRRLFFHPPSYCTNEFPHLVVSSPGHQTDCITSRKSIFVSRCGDTGSCSVDPRRKVTKVPGQSDRSDRGGGRETDAAVNALQWERLQRHREVHHEHILSQSPPTFLYVEETVQGRGVVFGVFFIRMFEVLLSFSIQIRELL